MGEQRVIDVSGLQALVDALWADGRTVLGPVAEQGVLVHAEVRSVGDLPRGVADDQQPGRYRLGERADESLFGYAAVPQSWKATFFPTRSLMWRGTRGTDGVTRDEPERPDRPLALLGVRACDLAAISVQDRVLRDRVGGRPAADPQYTRARDDVLVVAVTCGAPADTCFCAAAGTGPRPGGGADLVLTELLEPEHVFLAEAVTDRGRALLDAIPGRPPTEEDRTAADEVVAGAVAQQQRSMPAGDLRARLLARAESPAWDDVARRCLACTNCTLVCPTCFCTTVEDVTDLAGASSERWRVWDSCFTGGFSYVHGGSVRASTRSRYRQWLTHKFATWQDQFGTSGCVGCGRCIAWCPAAIDVTAELAAVAGLED
jgi:formate hydrogenlyase subunit 6/NADH:ubiquinone oxidoreductase subunit I